MHIAVFVGMALEIEGQVTTGVVQRYIKDHPSSGSIVAAEDVKDTLDLLVMAGFLETECDKEYQSVYKRYVPIRYKYEKLVQ